MASPTVDAPLALGAQIEARAAHPEFRDRPLLLQNGRAWTYGRYRDECVRLAHFLAGRMDGPGPGRVAMLLDNHMELLALYGACGYGGHTLFGVNTGLRGDTLAGVVNQAEPDVLVVDERLLPEVEQVAGDLRVPATNRFVLRTGGGASLGPEDLMTAVERETGGLDVPREPPGVEVGPDAPLIIIYTSGTTGLPKGIINNHFKLLAIGMVVSGNLGLGPEDRGYACMPLFHSNALFLGFMPAFQVGASIVLRDRFSASRFVPDVFGNGVTYWNYVGEPVHYVLAAVEKQCGGDPARIAAEITHHPDNRFRWAVGNGAAPPDIERFAEWFGLDDMFELYGSTEAAISTFRKKTDPRGCVGEITDPGVTILDERGRACPPAVLDTDGKITNYAEAVGEICRVAPDTGLFQGYFDNPDANASKYRDGVYHSGDLGHVLVRDERRFLFFDGRTDDWIRKDGENFSALQVARALQEHRDVVLAAAYGAPCAISDELVMVALKLRAGATFDPQDFFDFCERQVAHGGMDRKWFPDFVRLVDEFEYTQTEKILVRNLKRVHFDLGRLGAGASVYFRERGDTTFQRLTPTAYDRLRAEFAERERLDLLDR
jgi:fatty-acyl-CoA synthase